MPGIEFSTLNAQELRSLEAALRGRQQTELADEVAAELATRARRAPRWGGGALRADAARSTVVEPAEPEMRSRTAPIALALAAAGVLALGAGWALMRGAPPAPQPPLLPVEVAAPAPPAAPPPAASLVPTLPPPSARPTVVVTPAAPAARPLPARERRAAVRPPSPPPALPTPERRLRRAYDQALAAGADPLVIDRGQARFRQRLERASGPRRDLIYDQRIRELERAARRAAG